MTNAITDVHIRTQLKSKDPTDQADSQVKGLRIASNGKGRVYFYLRYRWHGRIEKVVLGDYGPLKLAEARRQAAELLHMRRDGISPKEHLQALRAPKPAELTFGKWLDQWKTDHVLTNLKNGNPSYCETIDLAKKSIGHIDLKELKRADVVNWLHTLPVGPVRKQRLACLRSALSHAVDRGLIEFNFLLGLKTFNKTKPSEKSQRFLSESELKKLLTADLPDGQGLGYADMLRVQLALGYRAGETAALQWSWVSWEDNTVTLPPEITKNGRVHTLPMSSYVREILKRRSDASDSPFVFPRGWRGRPVGDRRDHVSANAYSNWIRRHIVDEGIVATHSSHSYRKTCGTNCSRFAPREVVKKILNHLESDVSALYLHYDYMDQMETALEKWGDMLRGYEAGNVVPLVRIG